MTSILIHGGDRRKRRETALKLLAGRGVEEGINLIEIGEVSTEREKRVGISEIKTFLPHLYIRPRRYIGGESKESAKGRRRHVRSSNSQRGFAVFEAQRLTIAAQNALLKILEEPPAHLVIILTAPNPRLLLPTVVSRCLITPLRGAKRVRAPLSGTRTVISKKASSSEARTVLRQGSEGQAETQDRLTKEIFDAQSGRRLALFEEKIGYRQEGVLVFLDEAEACLGRCLNPKNAQSLTRLWRAKKLLRNESANIKLIIDELLFSW